MPDDGIVYWLPNEKYVGQTTQRRVEERMKEHRRNKKNVEGARKVLEEVAAADLDRAEAYYIGYFGTLKPDGTNDKLPKGDHRRYYELGMDDKRAGRPPRGGAL